MSICNPTFRGAWRGSGLSSFFGFLVCSVHLVGERNKPEKLSERPSLHTAIDRADPSKGECPGFSGPVAHAVEVSFMAWVIAAPGRTVAATRTASALFLHDLSEHTGVDVIEIAENVHMLRRPGV